MARRADSYRGARRQAARKAKLIWHLLPRYEHKANTVITVGMSYLALMGSKK